ncbi:MAG: sugar phosphate isomerase/epimerase [Ruminococcaceae bacterium]|nr:sugar phosphate isomerase/epimerase [Oscillospiraceae bacterium]
MSANMLHIKLCAFADEADADRLGQIKALSENGIPYLEIRGVDGTNIANLSIEAAKQFKSELDAAGIRVWSIGSPAGKHDINADFGPITEQFRHMMELAKIFEAKRIRLFSFYGTDDSEECFAEVCRRLNIYCDICDEYGVIPCHENEKGIYGEDAARCLKLHRAIPRLKAVFDPANFIQCGQEIMPAWEMLAPYVEYGHIKDALADGRVVPPGDGIGCLREYLPLFAAQGGEVLTLEPHLGEFVGLADLEQDGARSGVGSLAFKDGREAFDCAVNKLKEILGA